MNTAHMGIAGIGAVTGYGWGRQTLWNGLASGKPAATLYPGFGPGGNDDAWLSRISDDGDRCRRHGQNFSGCYARMVTRKCHGWHCTFWFRSGN